MDSNLLQILVCPVCKGPLQHDAQNHELICKADRLTFPIRDGVPVMLEHEARAFLPGVGDAGPASAP